MISIYVCPYIYTYRSPFARSWNVKSYSDHAMIQSDISFVSNGKSSDDQMFPPTYDDLGIPRASRLSSEMSFDAHTSDIIGRHSSFSQESFNSITQNASMVSSILAPFNYHHHLILIEVIFNCCSDHKLDNFLHKNVQQEEMEIEMRRLKLELSKTMDMYSTACKEALSARQKVSQITIR